MFHIFIRSKTENRANVLQDSVPAHRTHMTNELLHYKTLNFIIAIWSINAPALSRWITESWQCWVLCNMSMRWGYVWLTVRQKLQQTVIDQVIDQWKFLLKSLQELDNRQFEHLI